MGSVAFLLLLALGGLIVGGLARLAVPGRDPMPIWATIALGIVGSFVGGLIAGVFGLQEGGAFLVALTAAVVLLIAYRRVVQRRGITGPGARRP